MPTVKWLDEYSVGIEKFDHQHQSIIGLINDLNTSVDNQESRENIHNVLERLQAYSLEHLRDEEKTLAENDYPGLISHTKTHDQYRQKIRQYLDDFAAGRDVKAYKILEFLNHWWVNHIQSIDKMYSEYLLELGVA